jgi:hypothetical protein
MTLLELQMLKLILFISLFVSCSKGETNSQPSLDLLHLLANKYNGKCFEDFAGSGVMETDQCHPTGLRICYIRPVCAYDEKLCTKIKSCNIWMRSDKVDEGFNSGRFKSIKCP